MSELISGKEAWIAKAEGKEVEWRVIGMNWEALSDSEFLNWSSHRFIDIKTNLQFRLKPKTITINGIEVPKPTFMEWDKDKDPNSVTITFNSESEAKKAHESLGKIMFNAP